MKLSVVFYDTYGDTNLSFFLILYTKSWLIQYHNIYYEHEKLICINFQTINSNAYCIAKARSSIVIHQQK